MTCYKNCRLQPHELCPCAPLSVVSPALMSVRCFNLAWHQHLCNTTCCAGTRMCAGAGCTHTAADADRCSCGAADRSSQGSRRGGGAAASRARGRPGCCGAAPGWQHVRCAVAAQRRRCCLRGRRAGQQPGQHAGHSHCIVGAGAPAPVIVGSVTQQNFSMSLLDRKLHCRGPLAGYAVPLALDKRHQPHAASSPLELSASQGQDCFGQQ